MKRDVILNGGFSPALRAHPKRCRRCALPPQSKSRGPLIPCSVFDFGRYKCWNPSGQKRAKTTSHFWEVTFSIFNAPKLNWEHARPGVVFRALAENLCGHEISNTILK